MNPDLAKVEEDDALELPIEVVGEHVKSGRKILADYDSATGAVEVRPKYRELSDVIFAKVEEMEEWNRKQGLGGDSQPIDPDAALDALDKADAELASEEAKIEEEVKAEKPQPEDMDDCPAWAKALIQSQAEMLNKLVESNEKNAKVERLSREKGVVAEGRREMAAHRDDLREDIEHAQANDLPMPPKKNPRFGDKTPAYVDWLRDHFPSKYERKFGVTDHDRSITKFTRNGDRVQVTADIARRKTHKSEKPESDPTLAPDMDWNA